MREIVLTDDDLRHLENCFGPRVRYMGPWNSDGSFGYCSVGMFVVERALCDSSNEEFVRQLKDAPDLTPKFIDLLQNHGTPLIERIVTAYQQTFQMHIVSRARSATNVA